jgi:acetyl-CoA synthetase
VDTYWQTESGAHLITPIPGATPLKPGSGTLPFFGVRLELLESETGRPVVGNKVSGVLAISSPWPSIARTVFNNHHRYLDTYMVKKKKTHQKNTFFFSFYFVFSDKKSICTENVQG